MYTSLFDHTYSVMAVFGSSSPLVDSSVASVCNALRVPYLTTSMRPVSPPAASASGSAPDSFVARVGPLSWHVSRAVRDTVKEMKWRDVAVIVHKDSGKWVALLIGA